MFDHVLQERMEEIISASKRTKYERQNEREKVTTLTEEVDEQYKSMR